MAKDFVMDRRARELLICEGCGDTIATGEGWILRRHKIGSYWDEERLCQECYIFGPNWNPMTLAPFAPDS